MTRKILVNNLAMSMSRFFIHFGVNTNGMERINPSRNDLNHLRLNRVNIRHERV